MNTLPFTLDQLRILKAISEEGSFKGAAASLYVSQPAVSSQIQKLEKQLNTPLFNREGRRASFTEAGKILLKYCDSILALCQETERVVEDLGSLQTGQLTIGASQSVGTYLMPTLIGLFRQRYPEIAIHLNISSTRRTCQNILSGQADIAVVGGEVPDRFHTSLNLTTLTKDEVVLVVGTHSSFLPQHPITRSMLHQLTFVALDAQSTTRKVIHQALNHEKIDPTRFSIAMELSSVEAIKVAVQAGLGVAFLPLLSVEKELVLGTLTRLNLENLTFTRPITRVFNPNRYQSKASQIFLDEFLPKVSEVHQYLQPLSATVPTQFMGSARETQVLPA